MSNTNASVHRRRTLVNTVMTTLTALCALFATAVLLIIIGYIAVRGVSSLSIEFLTDTPKPVGEGGGIGNAIVGSAMMTAAGFTATKAVGASAHLASTTGKAPAALSASVRADAG